MKLYVIALAGLLILASGAYLVNATWAPDESPALASRSMESTSPSNTDALLRLVVDNRGDSETVRLRILDSAGNALTDAVVQLPPRDTYSLELAVPLGKYTGRIDAPGLVGSYGVDLSKCPDHTAEARFVTTFQPLQRHLVVKGTNCNGVPVEPAPVEPREETFEGFQRINLAARAPYPASPSCLTAECSVSYGFHNEGDLRFPVEEGASRITVTASWAPSTPASERLHVGLSKRTTAWEGCDEESAWCGEVIHGKDGVREVSFVVETPQAGEYGLSAWPAGPVGAAAFQDVNLKAVVAYSG